MTKEDKKIKKQERSKLRAKKNGKRNHNRKRYQPIRVGIDCPYQVELYDSRGGCTCGGSNYSTCAEDV